MKKLQRQQQTTKRITSIVILGMFFWWQIFSQSLYPDSLIQGIDLMDKKKTDRENFNTMVTNFCYAVKDYKESNNESNNESAYDSSQSLFLYFICKYKDASFFEYTPGFSEDDKKSYIKFIEDEEGNKKNLFDQNLPGFYYDTEKYIQTLFDTIISNYTSIYQANIYGYTNDPDKSVEEMTDTFSRKHFTAKKDKNYPDEYIKICSTDNPKYPKTCKKLKEYIYWAKNLITTNTENYLNEKNIFKDLPKNDLWDTCLANGKEHIVSCGVYGKKITHFTNLIYNELLFYALFADYYAYLLENKSDFKNMDTTEFQKKLANNQKKINTLFNNIETSREAIKTTIKMLQEIQYSFPIHIGFLMYNEDIYRFTSSMNKTLTPIYTLHDILRNVQKTD